MVTTPSPQSRSGTASPATDAAGYLLLTIQHGTVKQVYEGDIMTLARGELRIECVTLPIPAAIGKQTANPFAPSPSDPPVPTHDFWLVLRVGPTFEMPLIPGQYLHTAPPTGPTSKDGGIQYTIASPHVPNASVIVVMPNPGSTADFEDLDSLEVMLRQYKALGAEDTALANVTVPPLGSQTQEKSVEPAREEMRGKLVLVDEGTGEVVGEIDQSLDVEEEKRLAGDQKDKPVILDFGHVVEGYAPQVKVQRINEEDMDDWMLKGAHDISRGIMSFGSWSSKMMTSGADMFIRNSKPREEPVKFSPSTKANIRRAHNASVKTVNVTKTTVGMINNAIMSVVDKTYDKGVIPAMSAYKQMNAVNDKQAAQSRSNTQAGFGGANRPPPPIPPKSASLSAYQAPVFPRNDTPTGKRSEFVGERVDIPPRTISPGPISQHASREDLPAYSEAASYNPAGQSPTSGNLTPTQKAKRPWLNRIVLAGEVVLTSLESTAHELINSGTAAASSAAGHKYGPEAGQATALLGGSVRNVAVVYIDVRGVGRRALLKSTAKGFVKAKLKNGEEIQLQGEGRQGDVGVEVEAGEVEQGRHGEIVVGMTEVGKKQDAERNAYAARQKKRE